MNKNLPKVKIQKFKNYHTGYKSNKEMSKVKNDDTPWTKKLEKKTKADHNLIQKGESEQTGLPVAAGGRRRIETTNFRGHHFCLYPEARLKFEVPQNMLITRGIATMICQTVDSSISDEWAPGRTKTANINAYTKQYEIERESANSWRSFLPAVCREVTRYKNWIKRKKHSYDNGELGLKSIRINWRKGPLIWLKPSINPSVD